MLWVRASVRAPGSKVTPMAGMKTDGRNSYRGAGQAPGGSQGWRTVGNKCILKVEGQREEVVTGAQWDLELERGGPAGTVVKKNGAQRHGIQGERELGRSTLPFLLSPAPYWASGWLNQWESRRQWSPGEWSTGVSWSGHRIGLRIMGMGQTITRWLQQRGYWMSELCEGPGEGWA